MFHIIEQTIPLFLRRIVPDGMGGWKDEGGQLSLFAVSVLPPPFNFPNDVCSYPAGLVPAAWIREYSRLPLKGSRKSLLLLNKQSSKPLLAGG